MKKIISLVALIVICLNLSANNNSCEFYLKHTKTQIECELLPNIGDGECWVYANVGVNCKQSEDVYVNVHVYHGGEHVGSGTVTIPAGRLESGNTKISVIPLGGSGYATLKL